MTGWMIGNVGIWGWLMESKCGVLEKEKLGFSGLGDFGF